MVKTIQVDPDKTPDRAIKYCEIRMWDGTFKSPLPFLYFSVNEKDGAPPVMKLKKDLNRFSKSGLTSLLTIKKITVDRVGESTAPLGNFHPLDLTVQYVNNSTESFTMDGFFAIYAMGADGIVYQLKREELQEILVL